MLREVFELMMQVHEELNIACVGLIDGSKIEKEQKEFGNGSRFTNITVKLESTDVGYCTFKKHITTSSVYNGQVQGQTQHETLVAVPYDNISYMEFTTESDDDDVAPDDVPEI